MLKTDRHASAEPTVSALAVSALAELAAKVRERGGRQIEPMQLAALLLEKTAEHLSEEG